MTKNLSFSAEWNARLCRFERRYWQNEHEHKNIAKFMINVRVIIGNYYPTFDDSDFAVHNGNIVCDRKQMQGKIANNNVLSHI